MVTIKINFYIIQNEQITNFLHNQITVIKEKHLQNNILCYQEATVDFSLDRLFN